MKNAKCLYYAPSSTPHAHLWRSIHEQKYIYLYRKKGIPLSSEPASWRIKVRNDRINSSKVLRLPKRQIIHCRQRKIVIISDIDRQISDDVLVSIRRCVQQPVATTTSRWVVACNGGCTANVGEGGEIREYFVPSVLNAVRAIWAGDIVQRRGAFVVDSIIADGGSHSESGENEEGDGSSELHVCIFERVEPLARWIFRTIPYNFVPQ